ncbi:MAG: maleylacetoacetate isomerase [Hyphomicrobiaceae bacterium]
MFKLYGFWRSLATYRVRIALALKGQEWEETLVDLLAGEQFSGDVAKYNPHHTVPVLLDGSHAFTQSFAILEYLEARFPEPPLLPADPVMRAHARAMALTTVADGHPLTVPRVRKRLVEQFGADDAAIQSWAQNWQRSALMAIEVRLAARDVQHPFCFGAAPGIADICLASHLAGSALYGTPLDQFPIAVAINARCHELDAFSTTAPMVIRDKAASG